MTENRDTTAKLIAGAATGGGALLMFILAVCISQWKQKSARKENEKTGHASDVELHTAANGNHIALDSLIHIHSSENCIT
ncbi:hypothetical protein CHS0354_016126 [Potamilus streckersoni]|uniref:Uncharacterized protein n=1 Tax=Potamilus streckersoni TaxID=2493646 RepID=A0AAE0T230_9BIVA|nr:hypothetical protein CHS0354_016126 [Potamilus streckersoni]